MASKSGAPTGSPLRDVASMLRSFDHVGRSAGRRAEERNGGPVPSPGLDLRGMACGARTNASSRRIGRGCDRPGATIEIDPALVRAFEIEKESYEFIYATTYLPSWLWAPTEGMNGLMATP